MFLDSGGDGEDVGIEDNVIRIESEFIDEEVVGASADANFVFVGGGLPLFVEGHDDDGGAVFHDGAGLLAKGFFAFFHRDRVHDAFALQVFESFFEDVPF